MSHDQHARPTVGLSRRARSEAEWPPAQRLWQVWQRVAPPFVAKYQPYWKSPDAMRSGWEKGTSVLVEVTPARG